MNIEQIIQRFEEEFRPSGFKKEDPVCYNSYQVLEDFLRKSLVEVVESVPCEKKTTKRMVNFMGTEITNMGYNQHVKEVKEWKSNLLDNLNQPK